MRYRINPDYHVVHEDDWSEYYSESHSGDFTEVEIDQSTEELIDILAEHLPESAKGEVSTVLMENGTDHVHALISLLLDER